MIRPAETGDELREKYAKHFEQVAEMIRKGNKIPQAAFSQVFWTDSEITRHKLFESGLDLLRTVGVFQCIAQEHMFLIMNMTEHDV